MLCRNLEKEDHTVVAKGMRDAFIYVCSCYFD